MPDGLLSFNPTEEGLVLGQRYERKSPFSFQVWYLAFGYLPFSAIPDHSLCYAFSQGHLNQLCCGAGWVAGAILSGTGAGSGAISDLLTGAGAGDGFNLRAFSA